MPHPTRGRGGRQQISRRLVDMTGKISLAEKNDLATLVNAITERLHNDISSIFDSPPVSPVETEHGHHHWLSLSLIHRKENRPPPHSIQSPSVGDGSKAYTKAHRIIEKEEKEAMTPQLKELKKEALAFFGKWQTNVLQRLRDVNVKDPNAPQESSRGRGRGSRGARGGKGGQATRGGRGGSRGSACLTLATGPPRTPGHHLDRDLARRFPPIPNPLWSLPGEKRKVLLHTMLLLLLSLNEYSANSRLLLLHLTSSLNLPLQTFHAEEVRVAQFLGRVALQVVPESTAEQKAEENKPSRKWKVPLSGPGSGHHKENSTNIVVPLKQSGFGNSRGGYSLGSAAVALLGAMAESNGPIGSLFGMFPARPTLKMIETFGRDIQDFAFIAARGGDSTEFLDARGVRPENRRLRFVICMGGWITESEKDVSQPWKALGNQAEVYAFRWETSSLLALGSSLETVIKSSAWSLAKKEIVTRTIFSCLIESHWPKGLLKVSKIVDNPWSVGMVRAEKAGAALADSIMRCKLHGDRPVSLIGYGLAARVIYTCLMVLAERRQFGLVESVVMMGTPAPSESRVWLTLKSVVSHRLVNVYSENDYLLGFLYRTSNIHSGVAGLQEIQGADGVENHNVSDLVCEHLRYQSITGKILQAIEWEDVVDPKTLADERPILVERK